MEGIFYLLKNDDIRQNAIEYLSNVDIKESVKCVKIEEWSEPRTKRQNRYIWGWVYSNIVDQLNESGQVITTKDGGSLDWTPDILHEAFKCVYLALPPIETKKGTINQYRSTASLNKKEFSEYLNNIDKACTTWWTGVSVPPPRGVFDHIYEELLK